MIKTNLISYAIGLIGIALAIFFGIRQYSAKKLMRVFFHSIQNQAQSICDSHKDIINLEDIC